jgi:hypothetical protein
MKKFVTSLFAVALVVGLTGCGAVGRKSESIVLVGPPGSTPVMKTSTSTNGATIATIHFVCKVPVASRWLRDGAVDIKRVEAASNKSWFKNWTTPPPVTVVEEPGFFSRMWRNITGQPVVQVTDRTT